VQIVPITVIIRLRICVACIACISFWRR